MENKKDHKRVLEFLKSVKCNSEKETNNLRRELIVLSDRIHDFLFAFVESNIPAVHIDIGGTDELLVVFEVAVSKFIQNKETKEGEDNSRLAYRDVLMFIGRSSTSDEAYKNKDVYSGYPSYIMIEKKEVILLRVTFPIWKETVNKIGLRRISNFIDLAGMDCNDWISKYVESKIAEVGKQKSEEIKKQKNQKEENEPSPEE